MRRLLLIALLALASPALAQKPLLLDETAVPGLGLNVPLVGPAACTLPDGCKPLAFTGSGTVISGSGGALVNNNITGLVLGAGTGPPTAFGGTSCTNQFPRSLNASGAATCATVSLTADVTGVTPLANGGTNATTAAAARTQLGVAGRAQNGTNADVVLTAAAVPFVQNTAILSAPRTWTLPLANTVQAGDQLTISDAGGVNGNNSITVTKQGGDVLSGYSSIPVNQALLATPYSTITVRSDGATGWYIVSTTAVISGLIEFNYYGVNFNSANTDNPITIFLPTGFTRYLVNAVCINGASASLTTATFGVFTAAAGGGTAIVTSGTAITLNTASENTNNNTMTATLNNTGTQSYTAGTLYFRVQTAQGSAATANVTIAIRPMS